MRASYLIMFMVSIFAAQALALDDDQQKGLNQTVEMLKSSKDRQKAVDADSKAKDVDNKVSALAGSEKNKDEIYGVSANVFEKVVKESNGDPAKMQQLMNEASANPEAFYNKYFGDAEKAQVRAIANQIDKSKPAINGQK